MTTSIVRKIWMALTGLFLCVFLVVHMAGNLTLFLPAEEARPLYNAYSAFLVGNPAIKVISYVLYASIGAHVVVSILLTLQNRRARGDQPYAYARPSATSPWYARTMGVLGTALLVFLVIHMKTFWFTYHFGPIGLDANGRKDLYKLVVTAFSAPGYVALYVLSMGALGYHLLHGVNSAWRTLGLGHHRFSKLMEGAGKAFAIVVSLAFAVMPVWLYIQAEGLTR